MRKQLHKNYRTAKLSRDSRFTTISES